MGRGIVAEGAGGARSHEPTTHRRSAVRAHRPRNIDATSAGRWEERANFQHDSDGFPCPEVGALGHVRRDAKRHEGRWEERAEWGKGRVAPKLEHASDVHEGRWEERAGFKGVARRDVGMPSRHETPQERAARIAASSARTRPGDGGDVVAFDEEMTRGPTWAGDTPARNLPNPSIHCGPTPLWNAPTVNLPGGEEMRRKAAAGRAANADKENKESGNFALWMERGERGYTRTPGDLREVYTAGDNAAGERGNNLYRRRHVDLLGGAASAASGNAHVDRYRTTASEVSATAEEVRWEEENSRASEGSGLSNMASSATPLSPRHAPRRRGQRDPGPTSAATLDHSASECQQQGALDVKQRSRDLGRDYHYVIHSKGPHVRPTNLSACESVLYTCARRFPVCTFAQTCSGVVRLLSNYSSGVPPYISQVGSQMAS